MRVIHINALDSGTGAANAAARIHRTMLSQGIDSRLLVSLNRRSEPGVSAIPRSLGQRIAGRIYASIDRWALSGLDAEYVLSTGFFGLDIDKVARRADADVLQLHWIGGGTFRLSSLLRVESAVVWRMPDMWPFCGVQHLCGDPTRYISGYGTASRFVNPGLIDIDALVWHNKKKVYSVIERLVFVAPSRWLAGCARESRLLRDRRVEVVPTSCDTTLFSPRDKAACRLALGLDRSTPVILTGATCMMTKWKGADLLIDALNLLAEKPGFDAQLVCFGEGALQFKEKSRIPVLALGKVTDERLMAILYAAADVFVAPSRMENMANTVLESLACGTPAVAFSIGGMPDMIGHKDNGYLAEPYQVEDLAVGIRWTLDEADHAKVKDAARGKILAHHQPEQEARAYMAIYESLLA